MGIHRAFNDGLFALIDHGFAIVYAYDQRMRHPPQIHVLCWHLMIVGLYSWTVSRPLHVRIHKLCDY